MVKYILKKWYPSLPKNWEVGMEVVGEKFFANSKHKYTPYVFFDPSEITNNPEFWEKVEEKQPLFITEDGKEIFKGDKFYFIASLSWGIGELIANDNVIGQYAIARFSTREAAEKWVDENKPVYSKADINKALLDPGGKFWQDAYLRLMEEEL